MPKRKQLTAVEEAYSQCSSIDIRAVMSKEESAQTRCVLLMKSGKASEISVDMTPSKKKVNELLGGEITFLGAFSSLQVVALVRLDQTVVKKDVNKHKLCPPLGNFSFRFFIAILTSFFR